MNTRMLGLSVLLLSVIQLLVAGSPGTAAQPPVAGQPQEKAIPKWEYATITATGFKGRCTLARSGEEIRAESWIGLAEKLKVPMKGDESPSTAQIAVLNFLGAEGWEVISHSVVPAGQENARNIETYLFKRRIPEKAKP